MPPTIPPTTKNDMARLLKSPPQIQCETPLTSSAQIGSGCYDWIADASRLMSDHNDL
jgi:hypothetical protein